METTYPRQPQATTGCLLLFLAHVIAVAQLSSGAANFGAKMFSGHFSSNVYKMAAQHYLEGQVVDNRKLMDCVREYRAI